MVIKLNSYWCTSDEDVKSSNVKILYCIGLFVQVYVWNDITKSDV